MAISRRLHLCMLAVYLTTDDVIAATRDTMDDTIKYLIDKYGSVARYLHEVHSGVLQTARTG
jgi:hypothetical protein